MQHAVIFGHARPHLGVLIAPRGPGGPGSIASQLSGEEKEAVWSAVQVANAIAPSNAQISRNCVLLVTGQGVLLLDSATPLLAGSAGTEAKQIPIADKGTPMRPKTYTLFKEEINATYNGAF